MDISNQKFFVATGCSYGRSIDVLHNLMHNADLLKRNGIDLKTEEAYDGDDNIVFINVSGPSQGSDYQSDSITYTITRLLELGANPKNIYCLVEWSEYGRISFPIPSGMDINTDFMDWEKWVGDGAQGIYQYKKENPNPIGKLSQDFDTSSDIVGYLEDKIDVLCEKPWYCNSKIGNTHYMSVDTWDYNSLKDNSMFKIMCEEYSSAKHKLPQEFFVRRYVDNIVKTQTFLKTHNIKYNFCQIYSQFSGWYEFPDKRIRHFHQHDDNKWFNSPLLKERFPNNKSKEIHEVYPDIKPIYNLIDWDNFWFHNDKTGVFPKGGIDEWCIDTFGECAYGVDIADYIRDCHTNQDFTTKYPHSGVTGHPTLLYYLFFFNSITENCDFFSVNEKIIEKMKNLQKIDNESDEMSETLLFTSERFIQRQLNNQVSVEELQKFVEKNVQNI
tara:strand:+ start:575 stop:1900 length:1326 start_codon:yes stop_codon:yes gene_type:complete